MISNLKILHEFIVVFTLAIVPHGLVSLFMLTNPDYLKHFLPWQRIAAGFSHDLGKILLLGYIAANVPSGATALGLAIAPGSLDFMTLTCTFVVVYLCLIFVVARLGSKESRARREEMRRELFRSGGFAAYTGIAERCAYMASLWMAVIAEDLVFRGYLVLGLGARTGMTWFWVLVSIALSVVIHLYQGISLRHMYSHAFFAVVFIAASLLTGNVLAAILPHLIYDTIWVIQGWVVEDRRARDASPAYTDV